RGGLPREAHGPAGVPSGKDIQFDGDDAVPGTAATSVRHGSEALSMAPPPFESRTSVSTCDTHGIVQEYAADAADLFGWTPGEVIGKMSVAMFHVPKNVPTLVPRLLREAVEKGKFEEEVTLMRKDGSTFRAVLTV